jgi:3-oxoacyl-[acyl-carrier protein] reductase
MMNSYDLNDRTAVITGGGQGIGFAVAQRMHASGATVLLWDRDEAVAKSAADALGDRAFAYGVDVADGPAIDALTSRCIDEHTKVDVLVTSAGITGPNVPTVDYPSKDWQSVMDINLNGVFHCCRALVPHMRSAGYGRVVNIASVAGKEGNPNASAYSVSKAGVIALTKSLGKEHADTDIAVNCVTPAAAKTRIFDQMTQEHIDYMLAKIPRARFLQVDEAASMIVWLCTEENSFTTASAFDLSGGRATY